MLHALRDCEATREVWVVLLRKHFDQDFFSVNREEWLFSNVLSSNISSRPWSLTFGVAAERIWISRDECLSTEDYASIGNCASNQ